MHTSTESAPVKTRRGVPAWLTGVIGLAVGFVFAVFWLRDRTGDLSSRELSLALGIHHFKYTVPTDIGRRFLTFELRDADKSKGSGGSSVWVPGETITVTVRPLLDSKKLECSLIGRSLHERCVMENPFASMSPIHYANDGSSVNSQPLIKANRNGPVVAFPANRTEPGDVSLWVAVDVQEPASAE